MIILSLIILSFLLSLITGTRMNVSELRAKVGASLRQRLPETYRLMKVAVVLSVFLLMGFSPTADAPPELCKSGQNVLPNCTFSDGRGNWNFYILGGGVHFDILQGGGECHAPECPAGYMVSESSFVAGIYQQVSVTNGATYQANIVWLVFDSLINDQSIYDQVGGIGRKLGIDPSGGTDPTSPNVVWGPENWRNDCKICDGQEVVATAQADTITVFLQIDNQWKSRAQDKGFPVPTTRDQFWIDDFGMIQVDGNTAPPPPPTNTPEPAPTDTPEPAPTNTPEPTPTDTPDVAIADPSPTIEAEDDEIVSVEISSGDNELADVPSSTEDSSETVDTDADNEAGEDEAVSSSEVSLAQAEAEGNAEENSAPSAETDITAETATSAPEPAATIAPPPPPLRLNRRPRRKQSPRWARNSRSTK